MGKSKGLFSSLTVRLIACAAVLVLGLGQFAMQIEHKVPNKSAAQSYIVQAATAEDARALVASAGGTVQRELAIINGVEATLDTTSYANIQGSNLQVQITENASLIELADYWWNVDLTQSSSDEDPDDDSEEDWDDDSDDQESSSALLHSQPTAPAESSIGVEQPADGSRALNSKDVSPPVSNSDAAHAPTIVGANALHASGINGQGVTIAVVDSGFWELPAMNYSVEGEWRILAEYDTLTKETSSSTESKHPSLYRFFGSLDEHLVFDYFGHGTHVMSVMASSERLQNGLYEGIAPSARLIAVRAFDKSGKGNYADVIAAIDWIVAHKDEYDIRVINLSISAPVRSNYWDDPLNQAVMAAWEAGIVVVTSAGNEGPDPMTIGVPGNNPYVITVGAMTDSYSPDYHGDDRLATFSSAGPTHEGFVKPEIVAPGGHLRGYMSPLSTIARKHPEYQDGNMLHYTMSGTSQATAVVSGVAALMLQVDPSLTPDQVKCRIMASGRLAMSADGIPAYSVFQQGAGLVSAPDAVFGNEYDCANRGLDVGLDLAGTQHYGGPANVDENGNFYIMNPESRVFGEPVGSEGFLWSNGFLWSDGFRDP